MRFISIILISLVWMGASTVEACVCATMETCEIPTFASDVFIGKVVDSRQEERKIDLFGTPGQFDTATFQVSRIRISKVYNGGIRDEEVLIETDNFSTCSLSLAKGADYLIYAHKSEVKGRYSTGLCSGTKRLSEAKDDIKYLSSKESRVFGSLSYWAKEIKEGNERPENPSILSHLGIRTIFLENEKSKFQSKIGADGKYSFQNVPAGDYRIRLPLPSGFRIYELWPGDPPEDKEVVRVTGLGCKIANTSIIKTGASRL